MDTLATSRPIYARIGAPMRSPRSLEYDVFAQVTQGLRNSWAGRSQNFAALATALADNKRLWITLAVDLANPGNSLPATLRAELFGLYEFVDQYTRRILAGEAGVEPLVDINTAIMRGLRGDTGGV